MTSPSRFRAEVWHYFLTNFPYFKNEFIIGLVKGTYLPLSYPHAINFKSLSDQVEILRMRYV